MKERDLIRMAESVGLVFLSSTLGSTHRALRFKNSKGIVHVVTVSTNGRGSARDDLNLKAQMKRFARGQYHGLRIESRGREENNDAHRCS